MFKDKIAKLRLSAKELRDDIENKYVSNEIEFETAEEREFLLICLQLLPCFIEKKPLIVGYSKREEMFIKSTIESLYAVVKDTSNAYLLDVFSRAYNIFKLTCFADNDIVDDYLGITTTNLSTKTFVGDDFTFYDNYGHFFGDTNNHYKHHRKKTIFEK